MMLFYEIKTGELLVYFYPAQTVNKIYPAGGDFRFRVSKDGLNLLETHPMHLSILENDFSKVETPAMTYHTAVVDDAPEDTDVANVLMMGGLPMMIAGSKFVYQIEKDGTEKYLMTTAELMKSASK